MKPRSGPGNHAQRLEARETERLDPDLRPLWDRVCGAKTVKRPVFKKTRSRSTMLPLGRQAPATRATLLSRLNNLVILAKQHGKYDKGLLGLMDKAVLHELLVDHSPHQNGRTRWNVCRSLWRVAWECYGINAEWLLVGGRRLRAVDDEKHKPVDPDLPARMVDHGWSMAHDVLNHGPMDLRLAVLLRTAAHMCLQAVVVARLSEVALAKCSQIEISGNSMVFISEKDHSKTRVIGRDPIYGMAAMIISDYLEQARPLLAAQCREDPVDTLWVTMHGKDAEACCMAAAMRRHTLCLKEGGVASGDVRRAAVSQHGLTVEDQALTLRHVRGSMTAPVIYALRDRGRAIKQNTASRASIETNALPFSPPMPHRNPTRFGKTSRVARPRPRQRD